MSKYLPDNWPIKLLLWIGGGAIVFLLFFMAIGFLWPNHPEDSSNSEDSMVPDAYAEKTFDQVPDPTETPTCVKDMTSYELIKDSEFLKAAKIRLWIGGSFDNGLKVPKACDNKEKGPFAVITKSNISSVLESPDTGEASTLEWECGGQVPAQKYLFKGEDAHPEALFLISGENIEDVLTWHQAKEISDNISCVGTDPDYQISGNLTYEIADLALRYSVQKWKVKASEEEACTLPVAAIDRLILDKKTACDKQLESQYNCHGLPTDSNEDPDMGRILGVLTVKEKPESKSSENWLIFESPGYESSGYSVVPIDNQGKLDKKRLRTLVYSGC